MAGCSVAEIMALGRAWLRLRDEAARATTLAQLEAAAERFGKALGGTALRIVLALATAITAKVLPATMPRPVPSGGPPPAAALPGGGTFVLGATTPMRTIKILEGGLAVFMAPPAMSTLGSSNKARRSNPTRSEPNTTKPDHSKAGRGKVPAIKAAVNWKSVKQFGHTFKTHGAGARNTRMLMDRARNTGKPQGQWLDNQKAADFLSGINVEGPASVRIPDGLGQVIKPDGSIIKAKWARIVPNADGLRTAFPILPQEGDDEYRTSRERAQAQRSSSSRARRRPR